MYPKFQLLTGIGMLLLASLATSQHVSNDVDVLETESTENSTVLEKRAADCDFAEWQWADVDCGYRWDGFQTLDYEIKINPTGQENVAGWCKGIHDNIKGDCGVSASQARSGSCDSYLDRNLHHPKTHQVKNSVGIRYKLQYIWPWTEGDDATACITSAIKKATCNGGISFKNGKCYKL